MKKSLLALLSGAALSVATVAFISIPITAQEASVEAYALTKRQKENVNLLIDRGLAGNGAYELLESLTTEIGPRLAGSDAEARARQWGVEKLKFLGFKNVRIETFEIPYWARVVEEASIVAPFAQKLEVTALGNSVATPTEGITAEIVRFETLSDLIEAPMTGFEDKIIFVDEIMTRTQDGSGYGWAVAKRSGAAREAGRRNALAAVIRSVGTDRDRRSPHTGNMGYTDGIKKVPTAALSNPDADQLTRALAYAKKNKSGPVTMRLRVEVTTKEKTLSGNVVGEIPGKTDEIVVVGGHLDSWDLGTGAIDDGAGVAITTTAAKLVGDLKEKPTRTIRVVLWGSEEVGLFGARAYAQAHKDELSKHVFAAESDFGAGKIWQLQTRFGPKSAGKAITMARYLRRIGVGPGGNEARGGPDVSPLRAAGVPVVTAQQNGWDYFDLHHTPEDTLDKVSPEDLSQNVAAYAALIYMASEMEGDFRD